MKKNELYFLIKHELSKILIKPFRKAIADFDNLCKSPKVKSDTLHVYTIFGEVYNTPTGFCFYNIMPAIKTDSDYKVKGFNKVIVNNA